MEQVAADVLVVSAGLRTAIAAHQAGREVVIVGRRLSKDATPSPITCSLDESLYKKDFRL